MLIETGLSWPAPSGPCAPATHPFGFRRSAQIPDHKPAPKKGVAMRASAQDVLLEAPAPRPSANTDFIFIRPDTTIIVAGLPYDLTEAEAAKIANIVLAMATPIE